MATIISKRQAIRSTVQSVSASSKSGIASTLRKTVTQRSGLMQTFNDSSMVTKLMDLQKRFGG